MVEKVKEINYKRIFGFEELEEINRAKLICLKEGISDMYTLSTSHLKEMKNIVKNLGLGCNLHQYRERKGGIEGYGIIYRGESIKRGKSEVEIYELEGFPECCAREHVSHEKLKNEFEKMKIPEEKIIPEKFENFHLETAELFERGMEIPEEDLSVVRDKDDPVPCELGCENWGDLGRRTREVLNERDKEALKVIMQKNWNDYEYKIDNYLKWKANQN